MGIRSDAYFGVYEQGRDAMISEVRAALQGFDYHSYGVSEVRVESKGDDSLVIMLALISADASQADADAERAVEAISELLRQHFQSGQLRERQRELTLA